MAGVFSSPAPLGIVTGLAAEAKCFPTPILSLHGIGPKAARANAKSLLDAGANMLMSAGLAGGLNPDYAWGNIILADHIVSPHAPFLSCHSEITQAWITSLTKPPLRRDKTTPLQILRGTILSTPSLIATPDEKQHLYRQTRADAVDMESYAVAEMAQEAGKPFITLRVILDEASKTIPAAIQATLGDSSHIRPGTLLWQLARNPGEIPEMISLANRTRQTLKILQYCGHLVAKTLTGSP